MEDFLGFVADVGAPIAGAIFLGFFVFLVMKQMLEGLVGEIKTLTMFCQGLENRARTMSNEMVKIDLLKKRLSFGLTRLKKNISLFMTEP